MTSGCLPQIICNNVIFNSVCLWFEFVLDMDRGRIVLPVQSHKETTGFCTTHKHVQEGNSICAWHSLEPKQRFSSLLLPKPDTEKYCYAYITAELSRAYI